MVEYLVGEGADLEALGNGGDTPLHYAAESGRRDVVEYLVSKGADIRAKNSHGTTPLHRRRGAGELRQWSIW